MAKKTPKVDLELSARIESEISSSIGYLSGEVSEDRRIGLEYYLGEPFGNEVEGRSQVVSRDVSDVVDATMPQLARIFMASDEYVQFTPRNINNEEQAKQATEFCNYVLEQDNNKFNLFYTWFKDALIQKNGIVKVYWDVQDYEQDEEYEKLNADELMMLSQDPDIEITGIQKFIMNEIGEFQEIDVEGIDPMMHFDVQLTKKVEKGYPKVENVPPEDFLVTRRAVSNINDLKFCAQRRKTTTSELIIEGYPKDVVEEIPTGDEQEYNTEKVARFAKDDEFPYDADNRDGSEREIWVYECYIRYDYDNDGKSELRRVVTAGTGSYKILENEKADFIPFCSVTPYPLPHKFYGESLFDKTEDVQLIKSTLWRQALDNLYLIINGRTAVGDGVNLDDMLTSRPGGVVRMDNPQSDWANLAPADMTGAAYSMLEYCDTVKKDRTGIDDNITGLDPNTLQEAKTGAVNRAFDAAQMKIELIARVFAETGVKDLFSKMLRLLVKYQSKERMIKLRDQWIPMNPRDWDDKMDVRVNVGLGTGNKDQQLQQLMTILGMQREGLPYGLATLDQIYNTLSKMVNNAGFKSEKEFFTRPDPNQPPQQQDGDRTAEALIEAEKVKAQAAMQMKQMQLEKEKQSEIQKLQFDAAMEQQKRDYEAKINMLKEQMKMESQSMQEETKRHIAAMNNEVKAMLEGYRIDIGRPGFGDQQ